MRRALVVPVAVVLLGTLTWVFWPDKLEPSEMAPASLLGLVVINSFPDSLDFLPETRLGEWLDLDPAEIQNQFAVEWFGFLRGSLDRSVLVLHALEQKENGAFRPHITALLWPKPGKTSAVIDWIRLELVKRFGESSTRIVEEGSAEVIRGPNKGQILYLMNEKGWLVVSNSESGWKDVQLTLADRAPSLGTRESFREIQDRIGSSWDLFFYYTGDGAASLFPEFGYAVSIDGKSITDKYWSTSP